MNIKPTPKAALLLLFAFCSLKSDVSASDYHPIEVSKGGSLRGLVKYPGETAPRAMFGTRGDPRCPAGIPQEHLLVKQENRGIKNVLIVLNIDQGKPLPLMKPQLRNKGCRFEPRVQWAPKGTNLVVSNSDPTTHNVEALRGGVARFNIDLEAKAPAVRRPLVEAGLFKINCDRHLWERAWLYVSEHPYVAVTDSDGRFELTDIPPGKYDLTAWHEGWTEKGTEHTGQLLFQPMQQTLRVTIHKEDVTEVLLDGLKPAALDP